MSEQDIHMDKPDLHSVTVGLSFGLTSGIITTLGLMVGLYSGTHSRLAVLGGILTIAIADSFSDALGIHVSEESEMVHTTRQVWVATISTFVSKFFFTSLFIVPVLLLPLKTAIIVSVCWGLAVIAAASYWMARQQDGKTWSCVTEHLLIAIVVIVVTHYAGELINRICS